MIEEFKKFVMRGNVVDLAIGLIMGVAFGAIVTSLVNDIIMPPIGLLLGGVDFASMMIVLKAGNPPPPYTAPALAKAAGAVTINYGVFINAIITFVIVSIAVFFLIKAINRMSKPKPVPAPAEKDCPYCQKGIPIKATRCPFCTSELTA